MITSNEYENHDHHDVKPVIRTWLSEQNDASIKYSIIKHCEFFGMIEPDEEGSFYGYY